MNNEIIALKEKLRSDNLETCRAAVEKLAKLDTDDSTTILLDLLKSNDPQMRNLVSSAMSETRDQKYFNPLLTRINELGVREQIGTLVYALGFLDCSRNLYDIANLYLNAGKNGEVLMATTTILNEQSFQLTTQDLETVNSLLDKFDFSIERFGVKYQVTD
jgi:hypothetical protein